MRPTKKRRARSIPSTPHTCSPRQELAAAQQVANGQAHVAFPAEEGGAPPIDGQPDDPEVNANAALIRSMLDGSLPVPQPILDQVAALQQLSLTPRD